MTTDKYRHNHKQRTSSLKFTDNKNKQTQAALYTPPVFTLSDFFLVELASVMMCRKL